MFKRKIKAEDIITFENGWGGNLTLKDELKRLSDEIDSIRSAHYKFKDLIENYLNIDVSRTPEVTEYKKLKKGKKRENGIGTSYTELIKRMNNLM